MSKLIKTLQLTKEESRKCLREYPAKKDWEQPVLERKVLSFLREERYKVLRNGLIGIEVEINKERCEITWKVSGKRYELLNIFCDYLSDINVMDILTYKVEEKFLEKSSKTTLEQAFEKAGLTK